MTWRRERILGDAVTRISHCVVIAISGVPCICERLNAAVYQRCPRRSRDVTLFPGVGGHPLSLDGEMT